MRPLDPRLLALAPATRRDLAMLVAVGVLQGGATIAGAFALAALVVAVVAGDALAGPATLLGLALGARALLAWSAERVGANAGASVSATLRRAVLARWLTQSADRRPAPDAATTLASSGAAATEGYVARFLPALVTAAVVPAMVVLALLFVDWPSALIAAVTLPILPFFAALIGAATQAATRRRWRALTALSGHFLDVTRGLPTLVNYGRAERQVATIEEVSDRHRRATLVTLRTAFLSSAALELFASLSVAIVAVLVGIRLANGSMELGPGLLAILLAPEAYWPVRRVGQEFHAAADGAEALTHLLDELDRAPIEGERDVPAHSAGLEGVSYRYPGSDADAVTGLDLPVRAGLTVLVGPSGAGKTSALALLAGLIEPTGGAARTASSHLVTQRPFLPAGTIRAALSLGNRADDAHLMAALERVGLSQTVADLPLGLDTPLGDDGFGLSAGQRARLALARGLVGDAEVLLVDEPTANLDERAARLVGEALADEATRRPVIAVTHHHDLMARATHTLDLGAGVPS